MAFRGWPAEALEFYEGLEADNTKTYWTAHKSTYDDLVKAPMVELLAELAAEFGEAKIFRPNRDIRFSADKSPYKTAIGAVLAGHGYIQFSANGLAGGSGMWEMGSDQLERYRRAVDSDRTGPDLELIVADMGRQKVSVTGHSALKKAPKGYPADHPRIDLLRNKGLVAWKEWPVAAWLGKPEAKNRVAEFLRAAKPLCDWLDVNVGESHLPRR
jgi:uncharacterized protein (TIGR02453 family)